MTTFHQLAQDVQDHKHVRISCVVEAFLVAPKLTLDKMQQHETSRIRELTKLTQGIISAVSILDTKVHDIAGTLENRETIMDILKEIRWPGSYIASLLMLPPPTNKLML